MYLPDVIGGGDELKPTFTMEELNPWFERHNDEVTLPHIRSVVAGARAAGAATVVVLGFCWGGRMAQLSAHPESACDVSAFVVCHPSKTGPDDYAGTSAPGLFILAESDSSFPAEVVAATKERCAGKSFTFCGPYPGTSHGFAARGDDAVPAIAKARADFIAQTAKFVQGL